MRSFQCVGDNEHFRVFQKSDTLRFFYLCQSTFKLPLAFLTCELKHKQRREALSLDVIKDIWRKYE